MKPQPKELYVSVPYAHYMALCRAAMITAEGREVVFGGVDPVEAVPPQSDPEPRPVAGVTDTDDDAVFTVWGDYGWSEDDNEAE